MVYWITIYSLRLFFRCWTRFSCSGREQVPKAGGFVLVSNHISHFDPPVFSAACGRAVDWMGSRVIFVNRMADWFFRKCRVIKVRQYEADHGALREAIRRVRKGRGVGVFPEGGIRAGDRSILGSSFQLYEGAFMIAVLGQVPIVPGLVIGSDRLYHPMSLLQKRVPIWVKFGEAIYPKGKGRDAILELKQESIEAIRRLAEELKLRGRLSPDDWPQTPQQRNPKIKPCEPLEDHPEEL